MRKAFNFYRSYYDIAKELPEQDKLLFLWAILQRQFEGIEPNLKGMSNFAYISQKHSIDSQVLGYQTKTGLILAPTVGGTQGGIEGAWVQVEEKGKEEEKEKGIKVGGTKKVPLPPNPVFVECKRFWLNDFKQGWTFTGAKGKALKSIITKIKTACKNSGNEITDILLTETFKMICLRLPEFFKNKDLEIIDQKFNEIITEIKQLQNGNITNKDSNGKPISKYHN